MIFNENGIAFPDYQKQNGKMFIETEKHDMAQWSFCQKYFKNTRTCLDFGGHVGVTACRFSELFDKVISFEPIPDLFECLQYNTQNINNIEVHELAISNKIGKETIYINPENTGSNVIQSEATQELIDTRWNNEKRTNFVNKKPIQINTITIDSLQLNDVDFIKMDTEGYNMEPLIGMEETLKRCSPVMQIERGSPHNNEPQKFLENLGYKLIQTIVIDDIFVREE